VPVFWVESEDHDWEEVRGCTVPDDEQQAHAVQLGPRDGAGEPPIPAPPPDGPGPVTGEAPRAALAQHQVPHPPPGPGLRGWRPAW